MDANISYILQQVNDSELISKNKSRLVRFGMILLNKLGYSNDYTAEIFKVTRQCVAKWVKRFDDFGLVGLKDHSRCGRPKVLKLAEEKIIDESILSIMPKEKIEEQLTGDSVLKIIEKQFCKNISMRSVYRLLTKLKYTYSFPRPVHQKNDKILMLNWIAKFYKNIRILKNKYNNKEFDFYFQDETRYGQKTIVTKVWSKTGSNPTYINQNGFLNAWIYGAVNPINGKNFSLVLPNLDSKNMQIFLNSFAKTLSPKRHTVVILDGSKAHNNSLLRISKKLTLYFLPPYSPELNPIERLWQFIKKKYLSFKLYRNYEEIIETGSYVCNKITSDIIKSVCRCDYLQNLC